MFGNNMVRMKRYSIFVLMMIIAIPCLNAQSVNGVPYNTKMFNSLEDRIIAENQSSSSTLINIDLVTPDQYLMEIRPFIEASFGVIDSLSLCEEDDVVCVSFSGGDYIYFLKGRVAGFDLITPRFSVAEDLFIGGLKVGLSAKTPIDMVHFRSSSDSEGDDSILYDNEMASAVNPRYNNYLYLPAYDLTLRYNVSSGVITDISLDILGSLR